MRINTSRHVVSEPLAHKKGTEQAMHLLRRPALRSTKRHSNLPISSPVILSFLYSFMVRLFVHPLHGGRRNRAFPLFSWLVVASLLASTIGLTPSVIADISHNRQNASVTGASNSSAPISNASNPPTSPEPSTETPPASTPTSDSGSPTYTAYTATPAATSGFTSTPSPTVNPSSSSTATSTSTGTPIVTPTITGTRPPTYTIGLSTPAPSLTPIPDTNYTDQAIDASRDALIAEVSALPALTQTITGTLVSGLDGGRITTGDESFTLGLRPGFVPLTDTINVKVEPRTFQAGDPRATRNGQPLAYTFELTATETLSGDPVTSFGNNAVLSWTPDATVLAQAGVTGTLHVYTYDEQSSQWEEVPSQWDPYTHQLIATTSHFSLYAAGSGFDKVNNYLPSVNNFEMDLQSGTASLNYPIDVPAGPGSFVPKVSLSYSSGNVDRVDVTNQGISSVGWGWSLSMSYIAATQHHFGSCSGGNDYHPWTASIAVDGANGDLTKGDDGYWHTAIESFARIKYNAGSGGSRTTDSWEAWTKDGTHYVFDKQALDEDTHNPNGCTGGPNELTTYKWMLSKATDVHGNVINYSYWYQKTDDTYTSNLITNAVTRAVYPKEITYGANSGSGQDKARVLFQIANRALYNGTEWVIDISDNDGADGLYQSYRIERIETARWQESASAYVLQRAYDFVQDYTTVLKDSKEHPHEHLTLTEIIPRGNNGTTRLPGTTYEYYQEGCCSGESFTQQDWGHIYKAKNGYGGEMRYFYDAAGGDVSTAYRRVRSRWVIDGIDINNPPSPTVSTSHFAKYFYDYRGAATNSPNISAALYLPNQLPRNYHIPDSEFRGFTWVREQDPSGQVTDHYFAQDDVSKAKEWRVQVGKAEVLSDHMNTPTGTPTGTATATWTVTGNVTATQEPAGNNTLRLTEGGSVTRNGTIGDGYDAQISFYIKNRNDSTRQHPFASNFKLTRVCTGCTDYLGVEIYPVWHDDELGEYYKTYARVTWSVPGNTGTHDLRGDVYPAVQALPYQRLEIEPQQTEADAWYVVNLHTSPDGRFAVELRLEGSDKNYVIVKSLDPADGGGSVPVFPTGGTWRFSHAVTEGGVGADAHYYSFVDDYSEHRTVYSQSDTVYATQTIVANATPYVSNVYVGQTNNCRGMTLDFVPVVETSNTIFGSASQQPGQVKRTKTEYEYDTYGNQTFVKEHGDVSTTADDRSTRTYYVNAIRPDYGQYIVGKVKQVLSYSDINGTGSYTIAESQYFYDNQSDYGVIPSPTALPSLDGRANLTKVKQVGIVEATRTPPHPVQEFGYDQYGHQTWVRDPNYTTQNNTTITTSYDTFYHTFPITVTYPNGSTDLTQYNWQRSTVLTDTPLDATTTMTDVNGLVTEMRYDRFGRPSKTWSSKGATSYGSDSYPNQQFIFTDYNEASVTPPFAITYKMKVGPTDTDLTWQTRWYDGSGRTLQDVSPKDSANSIIMDTVYNPNGQVMSASLPYTLTNTGNDPQRVFTPDTSKPKVTKYYDGVGRPSEVRNPDYNPTTNPNSHIIYDYNWFLWTGSIDESGHHKWQRTDMLGKLDRVEETDVTASPTTTVYTDYQYDPLNHLTQVTRDSGGSLATTSTMEYDGLGRKKSMVDPDMGHWEYGYDLTGNLTVQRDALYLGNPTVYADHQIFFQYDNMNRIKAKYYGATHWNNGTNGTPDVKYYYDNDLGDASSANSWGKLRAAEVTVQGQGSEKANVHRYEYDPRGLVAKEVVTTTLSTRTYQTSYTYDKGGRLITTTYPDPQSTPEVVTTHYNAQGMGLPDQLTSSITSSNPTPVTSATYNEREQMLTLVQGVTSPNNQLSTTYTYDDSSTKRGWLTNTTVQAGSGGITVLNLALGYTLNGNISSVTQSATDMGNVKFNNTYIYDGLDRLTSATSSNTSGNTSIFPHEDYAFDTLGRTTDRTVGTGSYTLSYDDAAHKDAVTLYKGQQYSYDLDGNQTARNTTATNLNQTRIFDPENRVSQIISGTTSTTGPTITDFIYDANGQRLIKSVSTPTSAEGLKGEYYDNTDFTSLKMTRYDGPVDFAWGTDAPDSTMGSDTYSVRWTGRVDIPYGSGGDYTFYTDAADGVRLWISGTLLINDWEGYDKPEENNNTIYLAGGRMYDLKLEYFDEAGDASVLLSWSVGESLKTVIPASSLFAPISNQFCEAVAWANKTNVASSTNTLTKSGGSGGWNGGAVSTSNVSIPYGSNGHVEVTADVNNQDRMFGLSKGDTNQGYADIDFALHLKGNGYVDVYEASTYQSAYTTYVAGDTLRVAVEGAVVKYYKNGTVFHARTGTLTSSAYPLGVDTSIYTVGAKVQNAMLCSTRTHGVTQRTLYIGGVYEEELVGPNSISYTTSNTPYTSYYSFGGKLVGMRRANYSGTSVNGQFRMVSDHLGSTTLIVDTSATPVVVSREYHKPYGEVGWSGGSAQMTSLTSIGYTGQRLDTDSGLMFYNARMYDPVLSHFVSADTIASDPGNPKTRHRYNYVLNNPLKYTDLTGHCVDVDTNGDCMDSAVKKLRGWGFILRESGKDKYGHTLEAFTLHDLNVIIEAMLALMKTANWSVEAFMDAVGTNQRPITLQKGEIDRANQKTGYTDPDTRTIQFDITFLDNVKDRKKAESQFRVTVVHELAHAWDTNSYENKPNITKWYDSSIAQYETDAKQKAPCPSGYGCGGTETWADAVAAAVYPEHYEFHPEFKDSWGLMLVQTQFTNMMHKHYTPGKPYQWGK